MCWWSLSALSLSHSLLLLLLFSTWFQCLSLSANCLSWWDHSGGNDIPPLNNDNSLGSSSRIWITWRKEKKHSNNDCRHCSSLNNAHYLCTTQAHRLEVKERLSNGQTIRRWRRRRRRQRSREGDWQLFFPTLALHLLRPKNLRFLVSCLAN